MLSDAIIPEHYSDIIDCVGTEYPTETLGVFKADRIFIRNIGPGLLSGIMDGMLFIDWINGDAVFFGAYSNSNSEDSGELS